MSDLSIVEQALLKDVSRLEQQLADAQATVEALQADNRTYINERHENMKQVEALQQQLTQLQALVRALPILNNVEVMADGPFSNVCSDQAHLTALSPQLSLALANLFVYRATLDAMTPAYPGVIVQGELRPVERRRR